MFKKSIQCLFQSILLISALASSTSALATKVVFETSQGDIEVNLFDNQTPKTVENFLSYVNDGSYNDTVIHRSVPDFIIQGGGFSFEGILPLVKRPTKPAVVNEPVYSNRRATIAMAKLDGQANSATNQWFFNLANNHANLDVQNSGFTVFGQVTEGMDIVDEIAGLALCNSVPMPNYDCSASSTPGDENFVTIYSITISDTSIDSAIGLNPTENTLIDVVNVVDEVKDSGGSFALLALFTLGLILFSRKKTLT